VKKIVPPVAPPVLTPRASRRKNWVEQTNPLKGLDPSVVVGRLDAGMRGELPLLQWLYYIIEQSDPDLMALVERRTSAIAEMDWNIGVAPVEAGKPRMTDGATATLRAAYDRIDNLQEAVVHLALASFRGFSVCQLQDAAGRPAAPGEAVRIDCLPSWNFVRDGRAGAFKWNPEARQTTFENLQGEPLDPGRDHLLIRAVERPIDRVALVKFVRSNYAQKAWADYIEKVAKDGVFITEPPGLDEAKREEFKNAAQTASDGGGGSLPNGSTVQFANASRGLSPFEAYMRFLREQLVMAGTGGMLTMIASPTGIGEGATDAHSETFKSIARKEAREISEIFQRHFDAPILARAFPNEPVSAWFELAYREETSATALVDQGLKLSQFFELDPAEWSEKTGLKLAKKVLPATPGATMFRALPAAAALNRDARPAPDLEKANVALVSKAVEAALGLREGLLKEFFADLDAKAKERTLTDAEFLDRVELLVQSVPEAMGDRGVEDLAAIYEGLMGAGVANQLAATGGGGASS
jgi:phage gp29-like protein